MHVLPSRQKAFPFGEGVGSADGRGYCLPLSGKVSALPTEEVIAFPLWGRCRLCRRKRSVRWKVSPSAELNESKNKKVRALC